MDIQAAYGRWARHYDTMPNITRDLDAEQLKVDLAGARLGAVLELGCGTGKNTRWLAERAEVIGLDFSEEMLAIGHRFAPKARLHQADIRRPWPIEDASVDLVLADLVLEHIDALRHIATEAARVLKPGGTFRLSELHPLRQAEGKGAHFFDGEERISPHTFVHTTEGYLEAFSGAGFALKTSCDVRAPSDQAERPPRLLVMRFSLSRPAQGASMAR